MQYLPVKRALEVGMYMFFTFATMLSCRESCKVDVHVCCSALTTPSIVICVFYRLEPLESSLLTSTRISFQLPWNGVLPNA